jgi:hypothetical protein
MNRFDLSSNLIHLTKGDTLDDCFGTLVSILTAKKLLGGSGMIKGNHNCVCLSEAPISAIGMILDNPKSHNFRYQPVGLTLDKKWFFEQGGRPVIYQPDSEYSDLPNELQYRHVSFDPTRKPIPVDFTWEREWRLNSDHLDLDPTKCSIIIPKRKWIKEINNYFKRKEIEREWTFLALEDLGFEVEIPPIKES